MCDTCGCGNTDQPQKIEHDHDGMGMHSHDHSHQKVVNLNLDILSRNNITAGMNRRFLEGRKVFCMNLVSSPGSGKTTILEKTISRLAATRKLYVIEGDQQTKIDADRIERSGAPVIQINT